MPAELSRMYRLRLYSNRSAESLFDLTCELLQEFPPRTRPVQYLVNSGTLQLSFREQEQTFEGTYTGTGMKFFLVHVDIYWETVVGGRSVVFFENCFGEQYEKVFLDFFEYFEWMLKERERDSTV